MSCSDHHLPVPLFNEVATTRSIMPELLMFCRVTSKWNASSPGSIEQNPPLFQNDRIIEGVSFKLMHFLRDAWTGLSICADLKTSMSSWMLFQNATSSGTASEHCFSGGYCAINPALRAPMLDPMTIRQLRNLSRVGSAHRLSNRPPWYPM